MTPKPWLDFSTIITELAPPFVILFSLSLFFFVLLLRTHCDHSYLPFPELWSDAYSHTCSGASTWTELHTLLPASAYDLRVVAVNSVGESAPSAPPAVVRTAEEVPEGPPTEVAGRANGSQAIVVAWRVRRGDSGAVSWARP